MAELLRELIRGCFLGIAIGDALGMPIETMSHKGILKATGGGIKNYVPPVQKRIRDTASLPTGSTTDDTQLTLTVARSLITKRDFDLVDQAWAHVEEMEATDFGWGATTKKSITEIQAWFRNQKNNPTGDDSSELPTAGVRSPDDPASEPEPGKGCGNGVAMKIAPLAIWHFSKSGVAQVEPFLSDAMNLGLMTHGDPRASFAAVAVGAAIGGCLDTNPEFIKTNGPEFRNALAHLVDFYVKSVESRYRYFRQNPDRFSSRLHMAWALTENPDELRKRVKTSCFALESVPFALAVFLRHPDDFEEAVLEAVNAGGDTDTNASIVGGLCGALLGESGIPEKFLTGLKNRDRVTQYADVFFEALTEDPDNQTDLCYLLPR